MWRYSFLALYLLYVKAGDIKTCSAKDSSCSQDQNHVSHFSFGTNWTLPQGLFSNELSEIEGHVMDLVTGEVPPQIAGSLYRNGVGIYSLDAKRRVNNIIDGLSKIYCWNFKEGKVKMTAKFLRSSIYNASMEAGSLVPMKHMGEMHPEMTKWEKMKVALVDGIPDNNNIAMWDLAEGMGVTATTELPLYIDVARKTLHFQRKYNPYSESTHFYENEFLSASHFNRVSMTGTSYNYKLIMPKDMGLISRQTPRYDVYEYLTDANKEVVTKLIGSVPVTFDNINIIHSIGVTENYVILPRFNMFIKMADPTNIGTNIYWDARKPAVFEVLKIVDGSRKSFKFNAAEGQHVINSFERRNEEGELELIIDYPIRKYKVDYSEQMIYDYLNIDWLKDPNILFSQSEIDPYGEFHIRRYTMNMDTGLNTERNLPILWSPEKGTITEFPIINPHFRGKEYCFVFLHAWNKDLHNGMGLLKIDMCKENSIRWEEHNKFPMEPVFVPNDDPKSEDDGFIVSPVYDSGNNKSYLYIWNAENLNVVTTLVSPFVIPFGLHGIWLDEPN